MTHYFPISHLFIFVCFCAVITGCPGPESNCSTERCDVWTCGEARPSCPCSDLCERPECSPIAVYARDPETSECSEYTSVCEVPEGWEHFSDESLCAASLRMCSTHNQCGDGGRCDIRSCAFDAMGVCILLEDVCSMETDTQVVDCNGEIYSDDCMRLRRGAPFSHFDGESQNCTEGGVWGRDPASGDCDYFGDSCYVPDGWDYFLSRTACEGPICSDTVWAIDTFSGDCIQYSSDCAVPDEIEFFPSREDCEFGITVAHVCKTSGTCSESEVCDIRDCGVESSGQCVPLPESCVGTLEGSQQVCGCNDVTYENDCERLLAGVGLQHHGACSTPSGP